MLGIIEAALVILPIGASLFSIVLDAVSIETVHFLALLMFICSLVLFVTRAWVGFRDGRIAILALVSGFLVWYAFPAYYNCYLNDMPLGSDLSMPIDNRTVVFAIFYLSIFFSLFFISYWFFQQKKIYSYKPNKFFLNADGKKVFLFALVACGVGLIQYLVSGLNIQEIISLIIKSRSEEKPWIFWSNLGNVKSPFYFIAQSMLVAGVSLLWVVTQDTKMSNIFRMLSGIIALIGSALVFFDQGTRSITALVLLPFIILMLEKSWENSKALFIRNIIVISVAFLFVIQFQILVRGSESIPGISDILSDRLALLGGTTDYFTETLLSIKLIPNFHEYFKESVLYQFISSPIPRFLWSAKPASQVVWYYSLHRWGIDIYAGEGNVFPGIVGQYYMSWGWVGVLIIGASMGWFCAYIDRLLIGFRRDMNFYGKAIGFMLTVWIFLSYRVVSPLLLYPIVVSVIIVLLGCKRNIIIENI